MDNSMNSSITLPREFLEKIQYMVALKRVPANPLRYENNYYNALNLACEYGQMDLAKYLLELNCKVNISTNSKEETPLHYAVKQRDIEIIQILLSKKASVLATDTKDNTPLHLAFLQSHGEIIDLFMTAIEQTSNYINAKNKQSLSHLHIACTRDNVRVINGFLKAGASSQDSVSCDSTAWKNFTALHFAVEFKSLKAIKFLQKINRINENCISDGSTPIDLANQKLNELTLITQQLTRKEIDDPAQLSHFHLACMKDNPTLLENFIQNGASVNDPIDKNSVICALYRPLHFAVENNCLQNIEVLLRHGAEVGHQNDQGMTALHLAFYKPDRSKEKDAMVSTLYAAIDDVVENNRMDANGLSYFQIAVAQNDLEAVREFLQRGSSPNWSIYRNPRNFIRFTPLHFATLHGHRSMAELLIEHGAYVNANDEAEHGTPLHVAVELADVGLVELLLSNGALANARRFRTERTALHLLVDAYKRLAKEGSADSGKLKSLLAYFERLVELGCEVDAKDSNEDTALHVACSADFRYGAACVKKLLELGADVNAKNCWRATPFSECLFGEEDERGRPADYSLLYEHVQKLDDLGWPVDPKNVECCEALSTRLKYEWGWEDAEEFRDETVARKVQRRLNEVERMKNERVARHLSLYDFMRCDERRAAVHARNARLRELLENEDLLRRFYPEFGCLLRVQYGRAARRALILLKTV